MSVSPEVLQEVQPFLPTIEWMYNSVAHSDYDSLVNNVNAWPISEDAKGRIAQ